MRGVTLKVEFKVPRYTMEKPEKKSFDMFIHGKPTTVEFQEIRVMKVVFNRNEKLC